MSVIEVVVETTKTTQEQGNYGMHSMSADNNTENIPQVKPCQPLQTLRTELGLQHFRSGQLEAISSILKGLDTCVFWSTGSGKSICFQLPAIHRQEIAIIVSPLLSLINDQIKAINAKFQREIAISFAATNATPDKLAKIKSGEALLFYCTPERVCLDSFLDHIVYIHSNIRPVMMLAIDEAHFVSQQGFDFRPSYRDIALFRQRLPDIPMLVATATAPPHVRKDIIKSLQLRNPQIFTSSYDKPNLHIHVTQQSGLDSIRDIVKECSAPDLDGSVVVFTYTKKDAEKIQQAISSKGKTKAAQSAMLYHGAIEYEHRERVQRWFNNGDVQIVVATGSSFGTGIDKGDIRLLMIYGLPKTFEDFYQQIGRAGRDGHISTIKMFVAKNDHMVHLFRNKTVSKEHKQMAKCEKDSLFKLLRLVRDPTTCRRWRILKYFGEDQQGWKCGMCDVCIQNNYSPTR